MCHAAEIRDIFLDLLHQVAPQHFLPRTTFFLLGLFMDASLRSCGRRRRSEHLIVLRFSFGLDLRSRSV
jgi:hypothetical protein